MKLNFKTNVLDYIKKIKSTREYAIPLWSLSQQNPIQTGQHNLEPIFEHQDSSSVKLFSVHRCNSFLLQHASQFERISSQNWSKCKLHHWTLVTPTTYRTKASSMAKMVACKMKKKIRTIYYLVFKTYL